MKELIRLNRLLAQRGWASRREADSYIAAGSVLVNGKIIDQLGTYVDPDAVLEVVGDLLPRTTVILNKPMGIVSSQPEQSETPAIQLLTAQNEYYKNARPGQRIESAGRVREEPFRLSKLSVAGRLDKYSTGLLILTQNGKLASDIIHPDSQIEKEYLVRLNTPKPLNACNDVQTLECIERLRTGIECSGDFLHAVSVDVLNKNLLRFTLLKGKNHHIRRMVKAVGWTVHTLKRVRIGKIQLDELPLGKWRFLGDNEILY
jgi:23S rRNA pseudouridine2604 synthase